MNRNERTVYNIWKQVLADRAFVIQKVEFDDGDYDPDGPSDNYNLFISNCTDDEFYDIFSKVHDQIYSHPKHKQLCLVNIYLNRL